MTGSPRLIAAGRLRHIALGGADELATSRALLAELSALLRTYYRRALTDAGETVQRVGAGELRAWWASHQSGLVEMHREMARAGLDGAGVTL